MALSLADLKHRLRIDNDFSDSILISLMDAAKASLTATIGYDEEAHSNEKFAKLYDTFVAEYVRALYFHLENHRILDILQVQMQALLRDEND